MKLDNYIESRYRDLIANELLDPEYLSLYESIENKKLKEILASLHKSYLALFSAMNNRLPTRDHTNHFWAAESRQLLFIIEMTLGLLRSLRNSKYEFEIDSYYYDLLIKCNSFLRKSGGSTIPENMEKVELYYTVAIFTPASSHKITKGGTDYHYPLKLIGEGSYALIYKYKDEFYNKTFALKRAKKDLSTKELERFRREFEEMRQLSSPYVLEVYSFHETKMEYIMEFMDYSLDSYIQENNAKLSLDLRKNISFQILRAFSYLHSKSLNHRDISPKNILLKQHHDVIVAKVSDFGLVKTTDSKLTSVNTEFKGYFNDPSLATEGFDNYNVHHEIYALTKLLFYVMTGKTNTSGISDPKLSTFVQNGLNVDKTKRYQSIAEITIAFRTIF